MSLWERIMHLFVHHPAPDHSAQVDAAFRGAMAAQLRVATAAGDTADAAAEHRAKVDAVRARIVERTATHERRKHRGQTSHIAHVIDDALKARSFGGSDED